MSSDVSTDTIDVIASGIESEVATADEDAIGHVLMADVDDAPPVLSDLDALADEVTVLVETRGGAHVYGLRPRSWSAVAERLDALDAVDAEYADEMDRRGAATLRLSPEVATDGRETSPAPEVRSVRIPASAERVSAPHARTLATIAPSGSMAAGVLDALADGEVAGVEALGARLIRSTYRSREVANGGDQ